MTACMISTVLEENREYMKGAARAFLSRVSSFLGEKVRVTENAEEIRDDEYKLILVSSGGTARAFRSIFDSMPGPFILISVPDSNSLAASMEMISYINDHDGKGEILHGREEDVARRLGVLDRVFSVKRELRSTVFGVLGNPNMLINSEYDAALLEKTTGIRTIQLGMDEVLDEIRKERYEKDAFTEELVATGYDRAELEKAFFVYGAVKRLTERYGFSGVALRCFDLIEPLRATGCLALAALNAAGISASCEGDTRSLLSMHILSRLSGESVFMANPCRIDTERSEMVFAHCTLPLHMCSRYALTTHYESGLSVAVKGYLDEGTYTLFKCRENMKDYFVQKATLVANLDEKYLCRTQVVLKVDDWKTYLSRPLSNHQMIVKGDRREIVDEFFKWI